MPLERPREMTLIIKARVKGYLRDAVVGVSQTSRSPGEAQSSRVGANRRSVLEAEHPRQVHRMHPYRIGEVGDPQLLAVSVMQ
jgi:hypothetical protein